MSEYPWDIENMILEQHNQPCDCAICDDIHMARAMRRKRREAAVNCDKQHSCAQVECPYCEIDRLREVNAKLCTKTSELNAKLEDQKAKCNIYNCMDRKDLKLHIEMLQKNIGELAERGEADTLYWKGKASDFRSALDRIACGYGNEEQCHTIAKVALEI